MTANKFHIAWFTNFVVDEWNEPFSSGGGKPWDGEFYIEFARTLERACFDIKHPYHNINRRYILEVTEGLVPALQRRGAVRTEYTKSTLRETLREF